MSLTLSALDQGQFGPQLHASSWVRKPCLVQPAPRPCTSWGLIMRAMNAAPPAKVFPIPSSNCFALAFLLPSLYRQPRGQDDQTFSGVLPRYSLHVRNLSAPAHYERSHVCLRVASQYRSDRRPLRADVCLPHPVFSVQALKAGFLRTSFSAIRAT